MREMTVVDVRRPEDAKAVSQQHFNLALVRSLVFDDVVESPEKSRVEVFAVVRRGNASRGLLRFVEARNWLLDEAKKGRTIQRFKGLGEMNPEQLWETTVNPETRRMLQVGIEDAVAADQMFSMLMGEAVEPRRDFIEANALKVANLDI